MVDKISNNHLTNSVTLKPYKDRIGQGSGFKMKSLRKVKYPWMWTYHRLAKPSPVDGVKVMSKYLPTFYVIPEKSVPAVLPYIKKHMIKLEDGTNLVSLKDIKGCLDSRKWYMGQKQSFKKDIEQLKYTKEIIEELDNMSEEEFGRNLRVHWDSCIMKAEDEMKFQMMIRQ